MEGCWQSASAEGVVQKPTVDEGAQHKMTMGKGRGPHRPNDSKGHRAVLLRGDTASNQGMVVAGLDVGG
jgi:hypothetical protein